MSTRRHGRLEHVTIYPESRGSSRPAAQGRHGPSSEPRSPAEDRALARFSITVRAMLMLSIVIVQQSLDTSPSRQMGRSRDRWRRLSVSFSDRSGPLHVLRFEDSANTPRCVPHPASDPIEQALVLRQDPEARHALGTNVFRSMTVMFPISDRQRSSSVFIPLIATPDASWKARSASPAREKATAPLSERRPISRSWQVLANRRVSSAGPLRIAAVVLKRGTPPLGARPAS
jgi:hypothetical protein